MKKISIELILCLAISFILGSLGCGTGVEVKGPVEDDNPPVSGGFLEIANNPDANKAQKHLVSLLKNKVGEQNSELAFQELLVLKELELINKGIVDISALSEFTALETLILGANYIVDCTPLDNLQNLKELNLNGSEFSNLKFLQNLTKLEKLDIFSTVEILTSDFSILLSLPLLRRLSVTGTESNYEFLEPVLLQSDELSDLDIHFIFDINIENLKNMKNLKELTLQPSFRFDLGQLEGFIDLEKLYYWDSSDIKNSEKLDSLKTPHLNSDGKTISLLIRHITSKWNEQEDSKKE